jgi:hypothetical protein
MEAPDYMSKSDFTSLLWPSLKGLATGREIPAQALYQLIDHTEQLVDYVELKEYQSTFVPLITKSLECGVEKIQNLALKKIEAIYQKIEYAILKSQILPRILMLCTDPNIEVRKTAILLLQKTYTVFDKTTVNDQILSTLEKIRKLSNNYKINMTVLQIFEGISKNIGIDVICFIYY